MRRRRIKYKLFSILIVSVLFFSVASGFAFRRMEKPFEAAFAAYASEVGNKGIKFAIEKSLDGVSYEDFIVLSENSDREIVSMSANVIEISKIKADITDYVNEYVSTYDDNVLELRLGASQSNFLFTGLGPAFRIKVKPESVTKSEFRDEFVSTGINQVRHCIFIDVTVTVTVAGFSSKITRDITNSVLVADTVIVGHVPQVYGGYFAGINNKLE